MEAPGHSQEYDTLELPFFQFKPRSRTLPRALCCRAVFVHKGGHTVVGAHTCLSENVNLSLTMSVILK